MDSGIEMGDTSRACESERLDELYELAYLPVQRRCRDILGNAHDVDDAVQEVFRRAAERLPGIEHPLPWMLRVASNVCHDELRRRYREYDVVGREGSLVQASPAPDATEMVAEPAVLRRFLSRLSPGERAVVAHRWVHGLSLEEVAGEMGIAASTARNLLLRARRKIGEDLQRYCAGLGAVAAPLVVRVRIRARELRSSLRLGTSNREMASLGLAVATVPVALAALAILGVSRAREVPPPTVALTQDGPHRNVTLASLTLPAAPADGGVIVARSGIVGGGAPPPPAPPAPVRRRPPSVSPSLLPITVPSPPPPPPTPPPPTRKIAIQKEPPLVSQLQADLQSGHVSTNGLY